MRKLITVIVIFFVAVAGIGVAAAQLLPPADRVVAASTNSPDNGGRFIIAGTGSWCLTHANHSHHGYHSGRIPIDYGIADHTSTNPVWKELAFVRTNRGTRYTNLAFAYRIYNSLGGSGAQTSGTYGTRWGTASIRFDLYNDLTIHSSVGFYMTEWVGFYPYRWPTDYHGTKTFRCTHMT